VYDICQKGKVWREYDCLVRSAWQGLTEDDKVRVCAAMITIGSCKERVTCVYTLPNTFLFTLRDM
jgi:hypothetical protein